jgi:long-chain alkane monooxygenase
VITPGSYLDFVEHVMPELQQRGVSRRGYEPGTLREKLFGSTSRLPDNHPAAKFRRPPVRR